MRVNKWGVGIMIAAAMVLTGCASGSNEPADKKPTESTQEEAAPESNCPELAEGATIDGAVLSECAMDAMMASAGYAATMTTLGMETTSRYNPAEGAVETLSPMGSMVIIGDDVWVKSSTSEWQAADPESSDPVIAGLSMGAAAVDPKDPTAMAALSGEFTVTGTGTRLGQDVFLLTGTADSQGVAVDMVLEVTSDYVTLATTATTEAEGQTFESVQEVTEWDVKQDIVAPL